jgi:hypothetical protein
VEQPPPAAQATEALPASPEAVREALFQMVCDPSFQTLDKNIQKERVMGSLNSLEPMVRNTIFGEVYNHSTDPHKGGPGWGEVHCVDDLNVFLNALLATIP